MSTLRITGLASGIDYESMITKLMDAQRVPLDKLNQKKQINQWKQDDYRTLNNKILDFKNAAFDLKLQSGYLTKAATSSNESIATVTGSSTAIEGQYNLQVKQLASAATLTSGKLSGTTVGDMNVGDTMITINGVDIQVTSTDTYEQLTNNINAQSAKTGVKVAYDSALKTMFVSSTKTGASAKIDIKGGDVAKLFNIPAETITGSKDGLTSSTLLSTITPSDKFILTVSGKDYTYPITPATTVGELLQSVNSDLNKSGITASLDSQGRLSFDNMDKSNSITFSSNDSNILDNLGLNSTDVTSNTGSSIYAAGKNALVSFNNVDGEYESNSFTIAGINITAKQEGNSVSKISVSQDVDSVFNKIKSFIDKYNDLIGSINSELTEEKYRDYTPLTDAQRKEMSDTQIEQWEAKAKSGMLANDSLLSGSLYAMRQSLSSSVSGFASDQLKSLSEIGISSTLISKSTVSGSYFDNGKLYIDEDKLKQMIAEKPDQVMSLFTTNDNDSKSSTGDGIATRLYEQTTTIFNQIVDKAGTSTSVRNTYVLGKESLDLDKQISTLQTRLTDMETRYYNQFTAMEKYISQMNARSSSLASMFNTGG